MSTKNQLGFGIVPIIIIIVLVTVLGYAGYRVYTAQTSKPTANGSVTNKQSSPAPAAPTDPNAGYVVIKEWNVRFKPVSELHNVIYAPGPGKGTISFSTADLKMLDSHCDPETGPAIGGIERDAVPYTDPEGPHPLSLGKIGNYYYYYDGTSSTCSDSKSTEDAETKAIARLKSSLLSLEAVQPVYLDIKELGIKILLNSQISDAIYKVVPPSSDGAKRVGISAQSLLDRSANCDPANYTLGLIVVTTTAPTYIGGEKPLPVDNKALFKFGDTYYWYVPPQNSECLSHSQADSNKIGSNLDAFRESFKTVQLDKQ
jgi:hypothetical protein